jgi:hypothetical protein
MTEEERKATVFEVATAIFAARSSTLVDPNDELDANVAKEAAHTSILLAEIFVNQWAKERGF